MANWRTDTDRGFLGAPPTTPNSYEVMVIDGQAHQIRRVTVHSFLMSDVEDPELYAAEPLMAWQTSEMGAWVMKHAVETPQWHRHMDHSIYGYRFAITAKLKERDYTFWTLKWNSR